MVDRPSQRSTSGSSQQAVVFFVDDDHGIRKSASMGLREAGFDVISAGSGEEAMAHAEAFTDPIDVLVMDIHLPDAWGATLANSLKDIHPEMRVVFITGFASDDPILNSALNDAHRVLLKPFRMEELVEVVREAVA